jgi:hypothetical protein
MTVPKSFSKGAFYAPINQPESVGSAHPTYLLGIENEKELPSPLSF